MSSAGSFPCHGFGAKPQADLSGTAAGPVLPYPGAAGSGTPANTAAAINRQLLVAPSLRKALLTADILQAVHTQQVAGATVQVQNFVQALSLEDVCAGGKGGV